MDPYLIAGEVTIAEAAAPPATLRLLLIGLTAGAIILFPALYYLFRTFKGQLIFGPAEGLPDAARRGRQVAISPALAHISPS